MTVQKAQADKRRFPRITAPAAATMILENGDTYLYPVRDISRGGVFLYAPNAPLPMGTAVTLEIASASGDARVKLGAELIRTVMRPDRDEMLGMGFEFADLSEEQSASLDAFLSVILRGPGGERRAYPRISHRVDVWCSLNRGLKGLLKDLSEGGAALWLEPPVSEGEPITIEIDAPGKLALKLRGRVRSVREAAAGGPWVDVGVEFEWKDPSQQQVLRAFIHSLVQK